MKWFGIDYRYVVAAVGAVFIIGYESYVEEEQLQQPQDVNETEGEQPKGPSLLQLNERLADALNRNSEALEGAQARVLGADEKGCVNVKLSFPNRSRSSFLEEEKKYFQTFLLGLTCVETPSYYDHSLGAVNFEFEDGQGTKFNSTSVELKACRNFNADLSKQHIDRDAWAAAGKLLRTDPKGAFQIIRSGAAQFPVIAEEEGYESKVLGIKDDGTLQYQIRHLNERAEGFNDEMKYRIRNGSLNGVCLNSDFRDRLREGFPAVEINHVDKEGKSIIQVFINEEVCREGRPNRL